MGRYINLDNCVCNRFKDDKTFKYVVWLPRTAWVSKRGVLTYFTCVTTLSNFRAPLKATDDGTPLAPVLTLNTTNAYHFVVPFYDVTDKVCLTLSCHRILYVKDNDLFYQILLDQDKDKRKGADWYLLDNAATGDVNEIINTLNEKICEYVDISVIHLVVLISELLTLTRRQSLHNLTARTSQVGTMTFTVNSGTEYLFVWIKSNEMSIKHVTVY